MKPPIVPNLKDQYDVGYFDQTYVSEDPRNTRLDTKDLELIEDYNGDFKDFTGN